MTTIELMDKYARENQEIVKKVIALWQHEVVFSWRWWLGVILTILTWLIWIKYHKKNSRYRLLTAGLFVMLISVALDAIGVQLGLWSYRYEVLPFIPAYVPYDLALMPVVVMFLIQYKPHYSPVRKAIIFGLLTAFIGEPTVVFTDIYKPLKWQYIYSVPIYFAIFLIANWLTTRDSFEEIDR
ncbi:CBO0543 family protein [Metabacillus sp. YM-086]|uniref:CBO0543 family protein n=1 Tax=Metabacillus sp. YM-086 TaxID=3341729 RepID=UPI001B94FF57